MKRIHLFLIFLILLALYLAAWFLLPTRTLSYLVVDKTVPETDYREHAAIFWLTRHWRVTDETGRFLRADRDYLGYHPETDQKDLLTAQDLAGKRVLYLADTYGIYDYHMEYGLVEYELRLPYELIFINLLYGGVPPEEVDVIEAFSREPGRLIIGEHNVVGFPTYAYEGSSQRLQELFGIRYDGWLVRYYEELEEAAYWMKLLHVRLYGREMDYRGPGLILVREDSQRSGWHGEMLVFEAESLTREYPILHNTDHGLLEGVSDRIPYLYWLEILEVHEDAEVLAYYEFPVNEEAARQMALRGIDTMVPAMIRYAPPGEAERIYFGGDFADQLPALLPASLLGSARIQRMLSRVPGVPPQYAFYFRWYAPTLRNLLERYWE